MIVSATRILYQAYLATPVMVKFNIPTILLLWWSKLKNNMKLLGAEGQMQLFGVMRLILPR